MHINSNQSSICKRLVLKLATKSSLVDSTKPHYGAINGRAQIASMKGFTFLEIMVTIVIAALLVALALPNFSESIKKNRLAAKANDLMVGMKVARQTAIGRSVVTFMCHSNNAGTSTPSCNGGSGSDWNTGYIVYSAAPKTLTASKRAYASASDTIIEQIDLASGQNITVVDTNAASFIGFTNTGFLFDSAAAEFRVCDDRSGESGYLIRVSLAGKISRESLACT